VLNAYAAALLARLPRTAAGTTYATPPLVGTEWYIRVPEDEEKVGARLRIPQGTAPCCFFGLGRFVLFLCG
jgi:hypothetical protein